MNRPGGKRALAAIVMADVVGYSRLMGRDEAGTLDRLRKYRKEIIAPLVSSHGGRIVNSAGDSLLLEFGSAVDATLWAISTQQALAALAAPLAEGDRLRFRMGVNIGDVILRDRDVFGDSVNIAARLEALAEPGGLCLSSSAYDQVRATIDAPFTDLGPLSVKNISRPIGVFALSAAAIEALPRLSPPRRPRRFGFALMSAIAIASVVLLAAAFYVVQSRVHEDFPTRIDAILRQRQADLSDKSRSRLIENYLAKSPHRAFALAPKARQHWWTSDWPTPEQAEEKVLERCQLAYDEPCAILAVDVSIASPEPGPRDMPRLHYSGEFDPSQVPGVRAASLQRTEVGQYRAASGPKAAAIHPGGVLAVVSRASSQRRAESQALKLCNEDPERKEADGPCFLYAVGDQVVLPQRSEAPLTKP